MTDTATAASTPNDAGSAVAATAEPTQGTNLLADAPAVEQQTQQQDTTQAKPDEESTKAKPAGAPENYEAFTMPEGVELDAELGGDLNALAKELNLPQEQAQKLADLGAKQLQKFQAAQADAIAQARESWADESRADKEFGGDAFNENLAVAKRAVDAYASPALKTLLNQTGIGNHPEFIRMMWKAGQSISEDRLDMGRSVHQSRATKDQATRLYGNKN